MTEKTGWMPDFLIFYWYSLCAMALWLIVLGITLILLHVIIWFLDFTFRKEGYDQGELNQPPENIVEIGGENV